jgi:hypothetical protein
MMKKYIIVCIIPVALCLVVLCSCTYSKNVTYIEPNDGKEKCLIYQEVEYYAQPIFTANGADGKPNQGDVEIGMYYSFPFGTNYYSYTDKSPDYIYSIGSGKDVYLKQGFDYNSETFFVDKTSDTFVFSEALTETKLNIYYRSNDVVLHSEKHPNLKINAQLVFDDNNGYLVFATNKAYLVSPSLLEILRKTGYGSPVS